MSIIQNKKEGLLIAVAWMLIYASTPLYMYYAHWAVSVDFAWSDVLDSWRYITAFLVLFLLNHYVLLPYLAFKKRIWQYVASLIVCMTLFVYHMKMTAPMPPFPDDKVHQPFLLAPPDLARLVMSILMIGVDLGAVAWMNDQKMLQRLLLLEQQSLKQELEHLRYQINPHFLMNTLNNIHVLVDLDQERAKRAIVELSGLMRYALYEGNHTMTPLIHEIEFLRLYISLMKLRYNDRVNVVCNLPETGYSNVQLPPLLLATFVENAFKHGVSYREESFIYVSLSVDQDNHRILFHCVNSKHPVSAATDDGHHGIGLENVRKRLALHFGTNYELTIEDQQEKQFVVTLQLPYDDTTNNPLSQ